MRPKAMATANLPVMDRAMARASMFCRKAQRRKRIQTFYSRLNTSCQLQLNICSYCDTIQSDYDPEYLQLVER